MRRYVYRHLGYLRVNTFVCVFFFFLVIEIRGLCQEGRPTEKMKQTSAVAPPAGSSRKDFVAELFSGFRVYLFSASHQSRYEKGCELQRGVGRHWGGLNRTMEKCFQGDVEPAGQVPSTRQFNCCN